MSKIADFVVKRKKVLVTMVLLLTVFFTICFFQVAINYNMTDYLPEHANSTVALNKLSEEFGEAVPNCDV